MDARTYIETQVVGHTLEGKHRAAAEGRQAWQAQQREGTLDERWLERLGNGLRRYPAARHVVAALIVVLLALALIGQGMGQQAGDAAWRGRGGPRYDMTVKPERAGAHLAARGATQHRRVALQHKHVLERAAARPLAKVTSAL